ncbi:DUF1996 domain-containing protein [Actinomycetospora sp. NBRC 106378]|uniref:DUF1996 domain-containing protein n=1 Tax=Actinomycetospora sp. NBRC 106378 TaxID=3032208 RepID=UPI0025523FE4|nr:DUF1996 domain-containing protein [Actinomycetospora sp. NBRC 106378]
MAVFVALVLIFGVGVPLGLASAIGTVARQAAAAVGVVLVADTDDEGDGDDGSGDDEDSGKDKSGEDEDSGDKDSGDKDSGDKDSGDKDSGDKDSGDKDSGDKDSGDKDSGSQENGSGAAAGEGGFEGRDQIGRASAQEYVTISDVEPNGNIKNGGDFSGGSYSFSCPLSDHHNSDNFIVAPGKRNGAQHTHDYAGNESTNAASSENQDALEQAETTCTNGDRSPIFWPVLRDLEGVGPDVGADGGSLDGNIGSFVVPASVDYTFHGHGTQRTEPMPLNMQLITGSAKAGSTGEGSNSKFTCSGFADRLTERYPICPSGSQLQRVYDFPSCWNGQDLSSEDFVSHLQYPDETGECADDLIPVPALRITVSYDQPPGRSFAIDSFPEQQHDPVTDHALLEYLSTESRAQAGADCINEAQRCEQGPDDDTADSGPRGRSDELAVSKNFATAMAGHKNAGVAHGGGHR